TRVRLSVAELLALREAVTADVDRVQVGVVPEADGDRVRLTGGADGRDPAQALTPQVGDLSWCKSALRQARTSTLDSCRDGRRADLARRPGRRDRRPCRCLRDGAFPSPVVGDGDARATEADRGRREG